MIVLARLDPCVQQFGDAGIGRWPWTTLWCYPTTVRESCCALRRDALRAHNSAVECHLHTVEVVGSNPAVPTTSLVPNHTICFWPCERGYRRLLPGDMPRRIDAQMFRMGRFQRCTVISTDGAGSARSLRSGEGFRPVGGLPRADGRQQALRSCRRDGARCDGRGSGVARM